MNILFHIFPIFLNSIFFPYFLKLLTFSPKFFVNHLVLLYFPDILLFVFKIYFPLTFFLSIPSFSICDLNLFIFFFMPFKILLTNKIKQPRICLQINDRIIFFFGQKSFIFNTFLLHSYHKTFKLLL